MMEIPILSVREVLMAEFRFQIPDELIKKLQNKIGGNVEVTDILSSDEKGDNMIRLTMSSLEAVGHPPP
jgi:hypothetical protein